jgi:hypothetical protein
MPHDENKRHHLLVVQTIIARMGVNSFLLKGWSVTLVSALFALSADKANTSFVCIAFLPCVVFWALDGYFLWQERLFRALYDQARVMDEQLIEFSLDTGSVVGRVPSLAKAIFSQTVVAFHGTLLLSIVLAMLIAAGVGCSAH